MKKLLLLSVVVSCLFIGLVQTMQRVIHIETVSTNQFCMYMDSYKSKDLGLLGCFNGTPNGENEVNNELTDSMNKQRPLIVVSK